MRVAKSDTGLQSDGRSMPPSDYLVQAAQRFKCADSSVRGTNRPKTCAACGARTRDRQRIRKKQWCAACVAGASALVKCEGCGVKQSLLVELSKRWCEGCVSAGRQKGSGGAEGRQKGGGGAEGRQNASSFEGAKCKRCADPSVRGNYGFCRTCQLDKSPDSEADAAGATREPGPAAAVTAGGDDCDSSRCWYSHLYCIAPFSLWCRQFFHQQERLEGVHLSASTVTVASVRRQRGRRSRGSSPSCPARWCEASTHLRNGCASTMYGCCLSPVPPPAGPCTAHQRGNLILRLLRPLSHTPPHGFALLLVTAVGQTLPTNRLAAELRSHSQWLPTLWWLLQSPAGARPWRIQPCHHKELEHRSRLSVGRLTTTARYRLMLGSGRGRRRRRRRMRWVAGWQRWRAFSVSR